MFTNFIARAAQAGSEFVTLADLAQRVSSFEKSTLTYSYDAVANAVTATVGTTGTGLGTFALDLGTGSTIKSVANWYAYDSDSVFVAKAGGSFTIALGATPDDVTHITALPDRAELLSLTGDGSELELLDRRRGPCPGRPEGSDRPDRPGHGSGQLHPDRRQARSGAQRPGPAQRRGQSGPPACPSRAPPATTRWSARRVPTP